jgi:hypothetical protein
MSEVCGDRSNQPPARGAAINLVFNQTDFYDATGAFTWTIGVGVLVSLASHVDFNAQPGLRHVGGLADVDQLVGSGLSEINNATARLTFPVVVGVRVRFERVVTVPAPCRDRRQPPMIRPERLTSVGCSV